MTGKFDFGKGLSHSFLLFAVRCQEGLKSRYYIVDFVQLENLRSYAFLENPCGGVDLTPFVVVC